MKCDVRLGNGLQIIVQLLREQARLGSEFCELCATSGSSRGEKMHCSKSYVYSRLLGFFTNAAATAVCLLCSSIISLCLSDGHGIQ